MNSRGGNAARYVGPIRVGAIVTLAGYRGLGWAATFLACITDGLMLLTHRQLVVADGRAALAAA